MTSSGDDGISSGDDLGLIEIALLLWKSKLLIIVVTTLSVVLIGGIAWIIPKKYESTVVISPSSNASNSGMSALAGLGSSLGGLASLAGVSLSGDPKKFESLAILQSDELTQRYIESHDLLPILYKDKWDAANKKWLVADPKKAPTSWKANLYFKKSIRTVSTDVKTGISTLTIRWKDPVLAAQWANDLVKMTNELMKNDAIEESTRNIAYLTEQGQKTDVVGARQAIYTLLQTEINKQMLARGSEFFALKVLDPAVPAEQQVSPKKLNWLIGSCIGGFLLSCFFVLGRARLRSARGKLPGT